MKELHIRIKDKHCKALDALEGQYVTAGGAAAEQGQ